MPLAQHLRPLIRDPHNVAPALAALHAHLQEHTAPDAPAHLARELAAELAEDAHQLGKLMAALWREPDAGSRALAAQCCGPLGDVDLKRLLRFLQKAEKKLGDVHACDALGANCAPHARARAALFLREAQNRVSSKFPLVRRLGLALAAPVADTADGDILDTLLALLGPRLSDRAPEVRETTIDMVVTLYRRQPERTAQFLTGLAGVVTAQDALAAVRARVDRPASTDANP